MYVATIHLKFRLYGFSELILQTTLWLHMQDSILKYGTKTFAGIQQIN